MTLSAAFDLTASLVTVAQSPSADFLSSSSISMILLARADTSLSTCVEDLVGGGSCYMVFSIRYLVFGNLYLVFGIWYLVLGIWYLVFAI